MDKVNYRRKEYNEMECDLEYRIMYFQNVRKLANAHDLTGLQKICDKWEDKIGDSRAVLSGVQEQIMKEYNSLCALKPPKPAAEKRYPLVKLYRIKQTSIKLSLKRRTVCCLP